MLTKLYRTLKTPASKKKDDLFSRINVKTSKKKDDLFSRINVKTMSYNASADLCATIPPILEVLSVLTSLSSLEIKDKPMKMFMKKVVV